MIALSDQSPQQCRTDHSTTQRRGGGDGVINFPFCGKRMAESIAAKSVQILCALFTTEW